MDVNEIATKADIAELVKRIETMFAKITAPKPANETYLTLKEAADYMRYNKTTLGTKARAGEVPSIRDGHIIKFLKSDLDKYMQQRRRMSSEELESKATVWG